MNKQLEKSSPGSLRFIRLALLGLLLAASQSQSQEADEFNGGDLPLADLPGKRIDKDWFRYTNPRFGLAIDIPARGYRYVLPVNGSGMAVISADEKIHISIYAHFTTNRMVFIESPDDPDIKKAASAISRLYDHEVAETLAAERTITYRLKTKDFYLLAGQFKDTTGQDTIYYERFTISRRCPHVFSTFRITYPKAKELELSKFVKRLSHSLRSTCQGEDSFPDNR